MPVYQGPDTTMPHGVICIGPVGQESESSEFKLSSEVALKFALFAAGGHSVWTPLWLHPEC